MFSREGFPAFVGWAGVVFKVMPLIFMTFLLSFVALLYTSPARDFVYAINSMNSMALNKDQFEISMDIETFQEYRNAITMATFIGAGLLLLLLSIDISLIRGANTRNHKKIIPGMLVYALKTAIYIYLIIFAPAEFQLFNFISLCICVIAFIGISVSFVAFKNKYASREKRPDGAKIDYLKFDNEKA